MSFWIKVNIVSVRANQEFFSTRQKVAGGAKRHFDDGGFAVETRANERQELNDVVICS